MQHTPARRRLVALVTAMAVLAIGASVAYAAGLTNNTKTLPSANPKGVSATGDLRAWAMQIPSAKLAGSSTAVTTMTWGNVTTVGGGTVTISKYAVKGDTGYVTVTVKLGDSGMTLLNGMATMSGGDVGAAQITSTKLGATAYSIRVAFPGEQGRNPTLNLKWYTGLD